MSARPMKILNKLIYSSVSTFSMVFLFLLLILLGRYLGIEKYGVFATALAIAAIAEMIADFGLRDLCLRDISRDLNKTSKYLGNLFTWKIFVALAVFFVFWIVIDLLGYKPEEQRVIYIMVIASLAKSIKYTLRLFLQAHDRFDLDAILETGEKAILFVIGLGVLIIWRDLYVFAIAFCLVRILGFVAIVIILHRRVAVVRPLFDFRFSRDLQKKAIPFGLFTVVFVVLSYIDSIMLSRMCGFKEAGLYNAAFRIFEGVTILPTIFFMVMLPKLSGLAVTDKKAHHELASRAVKYMFLLAAPITVLGIIYAPVLITVYSSKFHEAFIVLRILFLGILFQFPIWMLNALLISINQQKVMLACAVTGLVGNVILNVYAIPRFGYNGAAVATVATEVIMFTAILTYLHKTGFKIPVASQFGRAAVAALLAGGAVFFLPVNSLQSGLAAMAGALIVYSILIFLFKGINPYERDLVLQMGKNLVNKIKSN